MSSPSEELRNPPSPTALRRRGSNSYSQQHRKGAASVAKNAYTSHAGSLHALIQAAAVERQAAAETSSSAAATSITVDVSDPSSSSAAYLASLSTQSLESLQSQPELLASSSTKINDQLSLLCQRQIGSLVEVHRSSSSIPSALASIQTSLDELLQTSLPHLAQVTSAFATKTQEPVAIRKRAARLIKAHNAQLSDLLNIPQLITTCVRSGFHTEALQLADHIATLARKESRLGGGPTLEALRHEAWRALNSMRGQLLNALAAQGLRLPAAKRIVNNLRKLRELDEANSQLQSSSLSLSEEELCTALLRARSHLLHQSLLSPIEAQRAAGRHSSNPSQHISAAHLEAYIDVWSQGVQETVSITQGLFSNLSFSHQALSSFVHLYVGLLRKEIATFLPKLLESLSQGCSKDPLGSTYRQVSTLLDETANALVALHTQLSFAASHLVPLGVDFTRLLDDGSVGVTLEQAPVTLLHQPAQWALAVFHRYLPSPSSPPTSPSTWLVRPQSVQDLIGGAAASSSIDTLVHIPPLAAFLNNILLGINALASFAPLSQQKAALHHLDQTLSQLCTDLLDYSRRLPEQGAQRAPPTPYPLPSLLSFSSSLSLSEAATRHRYGQAERLLSVLAIDVYCSVLVPYVRKGLLVDVFNANDDDDQDYELPLTAAKEWVQQVKDEWYQGEESRRIELEQQQQQIQQQREREREEARLRQQQEEEEERRRKEEQEEAEAERKRVEEEAERKRAEEEAAKRKAAEEQEVRRKSEEEAKRREEEEAARRKAAAEEEAARRKAQEEEAARRKAAEEENKKRKAEEDAEQARVQAQKKEEEQKRKERQQQEEEERRRKQQDEQEEKRQRDQQEEARAAAAAAAKRKAEEEEEAATKKAREEETQQRQEQEADAAQRNAEPEQSSSSAQPSPNSTSDAAAAEIEPEGSTSVPSPSPTTTSTPANGDAAAAATTNAIPPAAAPATRKLTLAEKLKIRQEERQRQAAAQAQAQAQATAEVSTEQAEALKEEESVPASMEADPSTSTTTTLDTTGAEVQEEEPASKAELPEEASGSVDGSSAQVSANPSDDEGEADGQGGAEEGKETSTAQDTTGTDANTNAKKRKNKKKKKAKK